MKISARDKALIEQGRKQVESELAAKKTMEEVLAKQQKEKRDKEFELAKRQGEVNELYLKNLKWDKLPAAWFLTGWFSAIISILGLLIVGLFTQFTWAPHTWGNVVLIVVWCIIWAAMFTKVYSELDWKCVNGPKVEFKQE